MTLTTGGIITLIVIVTLFVLLVRNIVAPDVCMLSGAVFLGLTGILEADEVFMGFTSYGVLTLAALFVVAAAVQETGALETFGAYLLGRAQTPRGALIRLALSVAPLSAFLNNTPVVAMMVPIVNGWCRKREVSPSRLLLPLSYFAILGGTCTLIGTSTTIVVNGLILDEQAKYEVTSDTFAALSPIGMFEITLLGLAFVVLGTAYLLLFGGKLLPDRRDLIEGYEAEARSYLIDLRLLPTCRLVGRTVQDAGLRQLPGLFLTEIVRHEIPISPVRPDEILQAEDILTFTGVVSTIVDLEKIQGLVPVADEAYSEKALERREKSLCEAVISASSPLIGKNIRDADFRELYNAAIIAVHRNGHRIRGRVGDIVLQSGDTLLLQAGPHFLRAHRNNRDFYLVSGVEASRAFRNDKAVIAGVILLALVIAMSFSQQIGIEIPIAASTAAGLMILSQCISPAVAREAVDWRTLMTIAGAMALGRALDKTGAAGQLALVLTDHVGVMSPYLLLGLIYVITSILTECVTTKGAAVLMFPIAISVALTSGLSPRPFAMAVLFASAASLMTPLGYQTNLMVYGPGGYKFSDFLRVGVPLNLALTAVALVMIPLLWSF